MAARRRPRAVSLFCTSSAVGSVKLAASRPAPGCAGRSRPPLRFRQNKPARPDHRHREFGVRIPPKALVVEQTLAVSPYEQRPAVPIDDPLPLGPIPPTDFDRVAVEKQSRDTAEPPAPGPRFVQFVAIT